MGRLLAHLQSRAGGRKSATVATQMVTDVSKFLWHADRTAVRPELLTSQSAIVAYLEHLERAGVQASGQQMKLARLQAAARFALLEADGEEELYRRTTMATQLMATLSSGLGAERSQQQARRMADYRPPDLSAVSGFLRSGTLTTQVTSVQLAVQGGGPVSPEQLERAMLVVMGRLAYR